MTIQDKQLEIANHILSTGLVDSVFHGVKLIPHGENGMVPAYQVGADWIYNGIDDSSGMIAYIRMNLDLQAVPIKIESDRRSYTINAPMRLVFFNDHETRDHATLLTRLGSFCFLRNITLSRIMQDANRLLAEETRMFEARFDAHTFYVAFDFVASFIFSHSDCPVDYCAPHQNPVKLCSPAAAPQYSESAM